MKSKKLVIAIDGYSSCGKSTLAKELANTLNYIFIDSGAMYRAVTLYCLRKGWVKGDFLDKESVNKSLNQIQLDFALDNNGLKVILLNGENCEEEIRKSYVASVVSKIAEIKEVREKLVEEQQRMGEKGGIVMDGRDIGTVVFPNADIKIFVTASIEVRTQRRLLELQQKGIETTKEEVQDNLIERDFIDSNRKESPLRQAEDAIVLDNSTLTREQQLEWALELVRSR
ncbi:MAG: (d)CMP kinase [Bacteroidota bacterium]